MKAGDTARLVAPVIQGTVKERRFTPNDQLEYLLEWADADGNTQTAWFVEGTLEQVTEA
jgi:hypothetical protein